MGILKEKIGGGNAQKSKMAREKNLEKQKAAGKGSQLDSNKKAMAFQCKVTFSEPDVAMRACVDPAPVIDGRRANCNLASLAVQRSTPTTPQGSNGSFRVMKSFPSGAMCLPGTTFQAPPAGAGAGAGAGLPRATIQQGVPYNMYG